MTCDCEPLSDQTLCGCCTGVAVETPEAITNRPALSSIGYRVGTWATFDASMIAALSDPAAPVLSGLSTRDPTDFSIALLDAWALALDILTFYQERFANEAFLRTAVDQRSVFSLAALAGYKPSPGVAASAALAFTLSSATGAPQIVPIPSGTRVQSVPGPGQTAQIFETSSDLTAQVGWNALPAQTTLPWQLLGNDTSTWISGINNNISVGDVLLFVQASGGTPASDKPAEVHYVTAVTVDSAGGNTQITWDSGLTSFSAGTDSDGICIYRFGKKAGLYGAQAPNPMTLGGGNVADINGWPGISPGASWSFTDLYVDGSYELYLDASYPGLTEPAGGPPQWVILTGTAEGYTSVFQITQTRETSPNYFTLTTKSTQLQLSLVQILSGDTSLSQDEVIYLFISETPEIAAYIQSSQLTPATLPLTSWTGPGTYPIAVGMVAPVSGSSVTVVGGQQIAPGQPVGISGQSVRLQIALGQTGTFVADGTMSGTPASGGQTFLVTAFPPGDDPTTSGNLLWSVQTLSGVTGSLSLPSASGAFQLMPANQRADPVVGEAAEVSTTTVSGDLTTLSLGARLAGIYDASTVKVNANTIEATNGQTVQEILGSGDASNPALQFTLKQAPLTYLTAPSGAQSTLQVWVNNLQWTEVQNLVTSGPADRVFVTSVDPTGKTVVTFGDGVHGARTPTGASNIRALYRTGIGSGGMVSAGQLSQPLDRPSGLTSVTNPGSASGAQDPATAAQARASAPLPTLTIGRVVSLQDYQNFALAFPGIAKALASWTWFGDVRGVFLTVAGSGGAALDADDPILTSLIAGIQACSEPFVPLQVVSYQEVLFTFTAAVVVDQPEYDPTQVLAAVWQSVAAAFAFDQRQLGQPVAASQIIELIQQVPGVTALQLQTLGQSGQVASSPVPQIVCASGPLPPAGAQMLLLDPATQGTIGLWSP